MARRTGHGVQASTSLGLRPVRAATAVRAWGRGIWTLLPLSMQIAFVVFAGYLLAVSPPMARLIDAIAAWPKTPAQAVGLAAFTSMGISWLNWGVGLVASAILLAGLVGSIQVARASRQAHPTPEAA